MQSAPPDIAFQSKDPDVSKDKAPPSAWRTPRVQSLAVIVCLLALVSWITVPRLPAGICFDDGGDLQLSSATLGIAHPPGYAGYVTVGFLLSRIPGVDPAYMVSVTCFVTGLFVLVACVFIQNHLGTSIWLSAAVTLALAAHPRFWTNFRAPEVYMPTLALLAWSTCFLLRFSSTGLRRYLALAVLLFGVALGNRPPVLFAVPFFLIAWHFAQRRCSAGKRGRWKDLAWMVPLTVAPTMYAFAYIYVRDRPDVCYNYIENHNEELHVLPSGADGVRAKLRRAVWHVSGEQFRQYMGTDWRQFVGKLRWVRTQVAHGRPFTDLAVFLLLAVGVEPPAESWFVQMDVYLLAILAVIGLVIAFRRCPVAGWLIVGLIVSCLTFVLVYHVFGQAADLLPLLFGQAILLGVLGSKLFPARGHWVRQVAAFVLAMGAGVMFAVEIPSRALNSTGVNATEYLQELDLASFPGPAVICANWKKSVALRYGQCVLTPRSDLHIVTSGPALWVNLAQRVEDRPVYAADELNSGGVCALEPFRNVFLLLCPKIATDKTPLP